MTLDLCLWKPPGLARRHSSRPPCLLLVDGPAEVPGVRGSQPVAAERLLQFPALLPCLRTAGTEAPLCLVSCVDGPCGPAPGQCRYRGAATSRVWAIQGHRGQLGDSHCEHAGTGWPVAPPGQKPAWGWLCGCLLQRPVPVRLRHSLPRRAWPGWLSPPLSRHLGAAASTGCRQAYMGSVCLSDVPSAVAS